MNFENFLVQFQKVKASRTPFVVVTLAQSVGSIPQELGARMIVTDEGIFYGTVGGGAVEKRAIEQAQEFLKEKKIPSHFVQWNLQKDLGMSCGGIAGFLFEMHFVESPWQIAVFGAGHVVQELMPLLLKLECDLTCIDSRAEWLEKLPHSTRLKKVLMAEPANYVSELHPETFIAVITMGHRTDLPITETILGKKYSFPYLGVIGSDTKAKALRDKLVSAGIPAEKTESIYCPIGEELGKNIPAEIAISITAQLLKKRDEYFVEKVNTKNTSENTRTQAQI